MSPLYDQKSPGHRSNQAEAEAQGRPSLSACQALTMAQAMVLYAMGLTARFPL